MRSLLELFADLARIELGVGQLAEELQVLAHDRLLEQAEGLREGRAGIEHLATTLATMQVELTGARSAVSDAIIARRPDLGGAVEPMLTLYRDVTRAELDVALLAETLAAAGRHHGIEGDPSLGHLSTVLGRVHTRLERDRGIMRQIEDRLEQFLAGGA